MAADEETCVVTVAYIEELRERARAWRLEAERLQAELLGMSDRLNLRSSQAETFAKYHTERASFGGYGREFHERAASFLLDLSTTAVSAPPLGVMPERIWNDLHPNPSAEDQKQRAEDLFAASLRYS